MPPPSHRIGSTLNFRKTCKYLGNHSLLSFFHTKLCDYIPTICWSLYFIYTYLVQLHPKQGNVERNGTQSSEMVEYGNKNVSFGNNTGKLLSLHQELYLQGVCFFHSDCHFLHINSICICIQKRKVYRSSSGRGDLFGSKT